MGKDSVCCTANGWVRHNPICNRAFPKHRVGWVGKRISRPSPREGKRLQHEKFHHHATGSWMCKLIFLKRKIFPTRKNKVPSLRRVSKRRVGTYSIEGNCLPKYQWGKVQCAARHLRQNALDGTSHWSTEESRIAAGWKCSKDNRLGASFFFIHSHQLSQLSCGRL